MRFSSAAALSSVALIAACSLSACQTQNGINGGNSVTYNSAPSATSLAGVSSSINSRSISGASSSGFDLTGRGGSEFTIPVSGDDSYTDAAASALDRCAQTGQKPTAPMQKIEGGKTVLAYSCS